MDLLYDAAVAWNKLRQYKYEIICGKNKKLYPIVLYFESQEFYHLAGFPHMKDITFPVRFSQSKMLSKVLDSTITERLISKSENYEKIVKRKLTAIIHLEQLLNGCSSVYMFNPMKLPFYTDIHAKYLLVDEKTHVVFLFTDTENNGESYFSRSTFIMDDHDFRVNQSKMTVLQVKRTNLSTKDEEIRFRKDSFVE